MILPIVFVVTATIFFYHLVKIAGCLFGNTINIPEFLGVNIDNWYAVLPSTIFQIWFWANFFKVI